MTTFLLVWQEEAFAGAEPQPVTTVLLIDDPPA